MRDRARKSMSTDSRSRLIVAALALFVFGSVDQLRRRISSEAQVLTQALLVEVSSSLVVARVCMRMSRSTLMLFCLCVLVSLQLGVAGSQYASLPEQERMTLLTQAANQMVSREKMSLPEERLEPKTEVRIDRFSEKPADRRSRLFWFSRCDRCCLSLFVSPSDLRIASLRWASLRTAHLRLMPVRSRRRACFRLCPSLPDPTRLQTRWRQHHERRRSRIHRRLRQRHTLQRPLSRRSPVVR